MNCHPSAIYSSFDMASSNKSTGIGGIGRIGCGWCNGIVVNGRVAAEYPMVSNGIDMGTGIGMGKTTAPTTLDLSLSDAEDQPTNGDDE